MKKLGIWLCFAVILLSSCNEGSKVKPNNNLKRAQVTLDSTYAHYGVAGTYLLRENYPFDDNYEATYLATDVQTDMPNPYSYLWPYSGTLSAVTALLETDDSETHLKLLESRVIPGLNQYFDSERHPPAYASYINTAPISDRFYDDNVWLGIDYTDIYAATRQQRFLDTAKLIWEFVASGMDDNLGGGIYWCEQKKHSKNTCSNAPGAVFALKLYQATHNSAYFTQGKVLYEWTKHNLQDSVDYLYFDNIGLSGRVDKTKYAYNSGQMIQAASLLYKITGEQHYLADAQNIAESCLNHFFIDFEDENGNTFKIIKRGNIWFTAVMLRGFIELYSIDKNKKYLDVFQQNLNYAWNHARTERGLFEEDFSGQNKKDSYWLLTQAATVEMYARMASVRVD